MEPPPRIFHYEGFFTQYRSLDIPLKVFFTLLCFMIILIITALVITRKHYKRVPKDESLKLPSVFEICKKGAFETRSYLPKRPECIMRRGTFNNRDVLVIEDWKLLNLFIHSKVLDYHFSCAPKVFRRKWHGLMMSDDTLEHRREMRQIILHAFGTLPSKLHYHTGSLLTEFSTVETCLASESSLELEKMDRWIWSVITDMFFFGLGAAQSNIEMHKDSFIQYLMECITSLQILHVNEVPNSNFITSIFKFRNSNSHAMKLLNNLNDLINPLIHFYLEQFINSTVTSRSNGMNPNDSSKTVEAQPVDIQPGYHTNLLIQLIRSHHFLKEEGSPIEFLTLTHIIHVLAESCMITHYAMEWILRTLFTVLALRPDWQRRLHEEAKQALSGNSHGNRAKNGSISQGPMPQCLSLKHVECLVWTKALVNEAIRFCVPGWPLGSIRQALRDGTIYEYDLAENDLVLFSMPSYYYDPELWESLETNVIKQSQCTSSNVFNPFRFLENPTSSDESVRLSLPMHWFRSMINDFTVCVPNKFIYLLTTSILLHLFGRGWVVSLKEKLPAPNGENDDSNDNTDFLVFPEVLPEINFKLGR